MILYGTSLAWFCPDCPVEGVLAPGLRIVRQSDGLTNAQGQAEDDRYSPRACGVTFVVGRR